MWTGLDAELKVKKYGQKPYKNSWKTGVQKYARTKITRVNTVTWGQVLYDLVFLWIVVRFELVLTSFAWYNLNSLSRI
jgi:hypothetical protein